MYKKYSIYFNIVFLVFSVYAQIPETTQIHLQKVDSFVSDTILVTASKLPSFVSFPINAVIISQNEIAKKNPLDVSQLLIGITGVDVRNYSFINGVSSTSIQGGTSQQALFLFDDFPLNSPLLGMPDLGLYPISSLFQVEIIKGPFSSIYGSNALAGVVNLVSCRPDNFSFLPQNRLRYRYGSFNTYLIDFQINNKLDKYYYQLFGYRTKSDGFRTNSDVLTQGIYFNSTYYCSNSNKINIDFGEGYKSLGIPGPMPDTSQHPLYGDETCFTVYDRQSDTFRLLKGSYEVILQPDLLLRIKLGSLINKSSYLWVDQYSLDTSLYSDRYYTHTLLGNIINSWQPNHYPLSIVSGIEFESKKAAITSDYPYNNDTIVSTKNYGFFTSCLWGFLPKFDFSCILRYDRNLYFNNFLSYSVGLKWTPLKSAKVKASVGNGFRAPTLADLFWPNSGNRTLKPELGYSSNLGIDYHSDALNFSLSGFWRLTKDLISWIPDSNFIWRPMNIDSSKVIGLEFIGKLKPISSLELVINATLQNPYQIRKELQYLDFSTQEVRYQYVKRQHSYHPRIIISSELNWEVFNKINILVHNRYIAQRINYYPSYQQLPQIRYDTKIISGYYVVSLRTQYRFYKNAKLTFTIDNLFNACYREQFGNTITDKDYPQPKRTIFMGVELGELIF
jgi:vitamin B12 transporter